MGRWHCLPPSPRRLCCRRRPQLPGRHPISPLTIHTPEPGDGDPRPAGADDGRPCPIADDTGDRFECCGNPSLCGGPHGTADDPGCYEETEYGPQCDAHAIPNDPDCDC